MKSDSLKRVSGLLFEVIMLAFITGYPFNDVGSSTSCSENEVSLKPTIASKLVVLGDYTVKDKKPNNSITKTIWTALPGCSFRSALKLYYPKTLFSNYERNTFYVFARINAP